MLVKIQIEILFISCTTSRSLFQNLNASMAEMFEVLSQKIAKLIHSNLKILSHKMFRLHGVSHYNAILPLVQVGQLVPLFHSFQVVQVVPMVLMRRHTNRRISLTGEPSSPGIPFSPIGPDSPSVPGPPGVPCVPLLPGTPGNPIGP